MEITRRFEKQDNYKVFTKDEIIIHHMSYVRKDIRKKLLNSDNGQFYKIEKFAKEFENYKLGDRLCIVPDRINRKTTKVDNIFGIKF